MIYPINTSVPYFIPSIYNFYEDGKLSSYWDTIRLWGYNTKNGFGDTDFLNKIEKKQDATLPYERKVHHTRAMKATVDWKVGRQHRFAQRVDSLETLPKNFTPWVDTSVNEIASNIFKSKFSEKYSEFQSLIPLAELKETRGLIRTTADITERLLLELIAIKRGRGSVKRISHLASDAWLQYSFAINPTIGDIESLLDTIGDHLTRNDMMFNISKGFTKNRQSVVRGTNPSYLPDMTLNWSRSINEWVGYRYTGGYLLNLQSGNDYSTFKRFGLTYQSLPLVGWELTPFSWVVDYFTTMGDFLEETFTSQPGKSVFLCNTHKYTRVAITTGYFTPNAGNVKIVSQKVEPEISSYTYMKRTQQSALPHRALRFKTYDEIAYRSINKLLNLSSVLVGMRK